MPYLAVLLLLFVATLAPAAEPIALDTVQVEAELLVADDFTGGLDQWVVEGNSRVYTEGGKLRIDTPEKGYATVWYRRPFAGNQLLRFHARVLPPRQASNINFFFCAFLPDGGDLLATKRTGAYAEYQQFNNYTMAFTGRGDERDQAGNLTAPGYMRLRKNPGFHLVDENLAFKAEVETDYDIALLKVGNRLKVFVNGRPALDWWDYSDTGTDESLAGGHAGFRTYWSRLEVGGFRAYHVTGWRMSGLATVKDLCLETDLSRARVVAGASPVQQQAARTLAAALVRQTGQRAEVVPDVAALRTLPGDRPLVVLGNMADNLLVRRLYEQWYCLADRRFPGAGGYVIQTIHNPWGTGNNVVLVGASADAELAAAAERFAGLVPTGGRIGRIYDIKAGPDYAKLRDWTQEAPIQRLLIPVGWPLHFALADYGSRDDARQTGIVYLLTGQESRAKLYREQMLRQVDRGMVGHLYVPGWMEIWDLMEEHPVFSTEDRLKITNWFLDQLRSGECMGALHLQRLHWGMPHQNHGTRPALGTFFIARYFQSQYHLAETEAYLNRIASYFDMQADWSKPMCDSSMHQWEATLADKAIYALASGNDRFFRSGAARLAAERALRTTNNVGLLPMIGDGAYGCDASGLLSMAAHYYRDGRYLWPMSVRENVVEASSDEVARGFAGDVVPTTPRDIVGVSTVPYDRGFWSGWKNLPAHANFNPPNIPYERAFDKIGFRTGLGHDDEFLLLDGMISASHDYDDANTIHEYMRHGRSYLVTMDGLFSSTFACHNGVNIIRDGLSTPVPYFAERIRAEQLGPTMVSQTRLNAFADADWTRTLALIPGGYFVVLDRVQARRGGTFSLTGHWKLLGEPTLTDDTLTVAQWPNGETSAEDNTTYFHLQAAADHVAYERLAYLQYGLAARYYPYAQPRPSLLSQARTVALKAGETTYLYTLGHETGSQAAPRFRLAEVAPGVVRVTDGKQAVYVGAPAGPVTVGVARLEADFFRLDAERLTVAGGRLVQLDGKTVLQSGNPVTAAFDLSSGKLLAGDASGAIFTPPNAGVREKLGRQLLAEPRRADVGPGSDQTSARPLEKLWEFNSGSEVRYLRTCLGNPGVESRNADRMPLPENLGIVAVPTRSGKVLFLDRQGQIAKTLEIGSPVNDVCVDDLDRNGQFETLVARDDARLSCVNADGSQRFVFAPERQSAPNSQLQLGTNAALHIFVADRDGKSPKTICVTTGDQRLYGVDPTGRQLWRFHSYAGFWTRHGLYDLNGDGVREIVGGNGEISDSDSLYFLDGHDDFARRILNDGWGSALSSMVIGDLNGDGRQEIVIGTRHANLHVIDPSRNGYLWSHNLGHTVTGCDLMTGANGKPLLVAGSLSECVTAFSGTGEKQWATPVGAPVAFLRVAGRAGREIVIAALRNATVVVLSQRGQTTHRLQLPSSPVALALGGRSQDLILVAGQDGVIRALTMPGK